MLNRVLACLLVLLLGAALAAPVYASSSAAASEGDINPLAPSAWKLDLALWTAVVFVVLALVLGKFAWKPLTQGLDKREQNMADQIAQAEAANRQAKELLAGYEQKLGDARQEVRGIVEQGRREAEKIGQEMLDKAKAEAKAEQQRALAQIDAATTAAIKELADQSATLAVELAGKIVRAKLNPRDHAALIEQSIKNFAVQKPGERTASRN